MTTAQRTAGNVRSIDRLKGWWSNLTLMHTQSKHHRSTRLRNLLVDRAAHGAATQPLRRPRPPRTGALGVRSSRRADRPSRQVEGRRSPTTTSQAARAPQPAHTPDPVRRLTKSSTHFGRRPVHLERACSRAQSAARRGVLAVRCRFSSSNGRFGAPRNGLSARTRCSRVGLGSRPQTAAGASASTEEPHFGTGSVRHELADGLASLTR